MPNYANFNNKEYDENRIFEIPYVIETFIFIYKLLFHIILHTFLLHSYFGVSVRRGFLQLS
jgi:hypothetical protein